MLICQRYQLTRSTLYQESPFLLGGHEKGETFHMKNEDRLREEDGTLTSEALAALIVDALFQAKKIKKEDFDEALAIAIEEIDVRKGAGDY